MHNTNQISIIIACYNSEKTIERAVKSALNQENVAQVIVIDDASSDNSVEVAKSLDDNTNRLLVLTSDINKGPSAARNAAFDHANGDWIAILDADDFLLPGRMGKLLAQSEGYDLIADDLFQTPEDNIEPPYQTLLQPALEEDIGISLEEFVLSNVTQKNKSRKELGFIKPIMRKSKLDAHSIRYKDHMRLGEDYELYTRLMAHGARLKIIPAAGYVSVRRENSLSGAHATRDLKHLRDCNKQLLADFDLTASQQSALKAHYISTDCRYQWRALIDAVHERNMGKAIACFIRPLPVQMYLLSKLAEHFMHNRATSA